MYDTHGFRPARAYDATEAAEIFADRLSRREFGKLGRVGALRLDSHTVEGGKTVAWHFVAYVGRLSRGEGSGTISGHNIQFTVRERN
jgi:hypothetical protein